MTHQELKIKLLETNYFEDNEYLDNYCELIISNLETKKEKGITQIHHIIPRCYYVLNKQIINNSKENTVNLKYIDHILSHYYMCLCSIGTLKYRLANAFLHLVNRKWKCENFNPEIDLSEHQHIYEEYYGSLSNKNVSLETRLKMSNSQKGKRKPNVAKKLRGKPNYSTSKFFNIYCLELDEMFNSTFDIRQKYPKLVVGTILQILKYNSLNPKYQTCKNTHWCYGFETKEESKQYLLKTIKDLSPLPSKNSKPIQSLETGDVYQNSIVAGIKIVGRKVSNISESANCFSKGKPKIAYGSHWVYLEDINKPYNKEERESMLSKILPAYYVVMKPVQNLETGDVYNDTKAAEIVMCGRRTTNVGKSATAFARGINKLAYGYHWVRLENHNNIPYDEEERQNLLNSPFLVQLPPRNGKVVQNLNTGEVYENTRKAEKAICGKVTTNILMSALNYSKGKPKRAYGSYWVYLEGHNDVPYTPEERQELLTKILQNS